MMDKFLGKDLNYWMEIDRWSKKNNYDDLIKELADLRFKVLTYEKFFDRVNKELGAYENKSR